MDEWSPQGYWIRPVDPDVDYEEQPDGSWGLFCEAPRREECGKPATWMIGDEDWQRKKAKVLCHQHALRYCRGRIKPALAKLIINDTERTLT